METGETTARYECALCGKVAATLALLPKNSQHTDVLQAGVATLVLSDFIGKTSEQVSEQIESALRAALEEKCAVKLYKLNRLWAPFYCPECAAAYCINHWAVETRYNDEFPGFYDCSYGTCPKGHRRMIDD
jgi:hypothetical protein